MGNCCCADAQVDHRNSSNIASTPGTSKYIGKESALSSSSAGNSLFSTSGTIDESNPNGEILPTSNLRIFSFAELKNATKNFKSDTVLGEGGFGKVFKGWIDEKYPAKSSSGYVVAVKKLNSESMQGFEEWQAEVNFSGGLSHPNLVRLLGYCWEDKELLLVYELTSSCKKEVWRTTSSEISKKSRDNSN